MLRDRESSELNMSANYLNSHLNSSQDETLKPSSFHNQERPVVHGKSKIFERS